MLSLLLHPRIRIIFQSNLILYFLRDLWLTIFLLIARNLQLEFNHLALNASFSLEYMWEIFFQFYQKKVQIQSNFMKSATFISLLTSSLQGLIKFHHCGTNQAELVKFEKLEASNMLVPSKLCKHHFLLEDGLVSLQQ